MAICPRHGRPNVATIYSVDWLGDVFGRFRRDIPQLIGIWVILTVAVLAFLWIRGATFDPIAVVGLMTAAAITFGPLAWARFEIPVIRTPEHRLRRTIVVFGLVCAWTVIATAVIAGIALIVVR